MATTTQSIVWEKCPSVTGGGKDYFYTTLAGGRRYWVVWDRVANSWVLQAEKTRDLSPVGELVKTVAEGKKRAEELARDFPQL